MPYPIAHAAAAVPLRALLGRRGVPSALAIGCIVPDLWYFVPLAERDQTHSLAGLFWFCLPVSLALYALFHLLVKRPLIALLPEPLGPRAAAFATRGLPKASWLAVGASALAGAASHLAWDSVTHGPDALQRVLQHASTLAGTAFLLVWVWHKLRHALPSASAERLPAAWRWAIVSLLLGFAAAAGAASALELLPLARPDYEALRDLVRASAIRAAETLLAALLAYCLAWRALSARRDVPRHEHREH